MFSTPITRETRNLPTATVGQAAAVSIEIIGVGARIIIGSGTTRP